MGDRQNPVTKTQRPRFREKCVEDESAWGQTIHSADCRQDESPVEGRTVMSASGAGAVGCHGCEVKRAWMLTQETSPKCPIADSTTKAKAKIFQREPQMKTLVTRR